MCRLSSSSLAMAPSTLLLLPTSLFRFPLYHGHLRSNHASPALFLPLPSIRSSHASPFPVSALPTFRLDPLLLRNSLHSSLNLVTLCGFVAFMQKFGHLPPTTASVLSQVSFNLIIPSFLMSKACLTIASNHERSVFSLPVIAIVQIIVGGILGRLSCLFLFRKINNMKSKDRNAITKEALVTVACAFGNSVTLPLVFLNGMLPQADYGSAAGYLALFLIGWSPCLWTLGYQILSSRSTGSRIGENAKHSHWLKNLMNPPVYGVLFGILIGSNPLLHFFWSPNMKHGLLQFSSIKGKVLILLGSFMTRILETILEVAKLLGSATVPLQAIVLASTLASSINHIPMRKANAVGVEDANIAGSVNEYNLDTKSFWTVVVIKLLIMPIITLMLLRVVPQEWMPADRIAQLTILVASAMPTAQNLVVLAQLNSDTQPFAGAIANLLVRQYAVAMVTITAWMPIFFSYLSIN